MSVKSADTGNLKNHTHKLNELTSYPYKALILDISGYTGSVLNIDPLPNRNGIDDYAVWVNGVTYEDLYDSTSPSTIDLTSTGLGGIIDGITFTAANARDFLIWGLANNANNGFDGFAVTHKPYSAYTGPAAVAMGATITFTGLTSAYQFTVGARAVVRNQETDGGSTPAPQWQWNWGTITEIVSSTSIKIAMDNNAAYGVALTAATSGEIQQWDKFRPWVVTASDQTLYTNNYRLIGNFHTDASGNINQVSRVDDPWSASRNFPVYINATATVGAGSLSILSLGREYPLWANAVDILLILSDSTANKLYEVKSALGTSRTYIQGATFPGFTIRINGEIKTNAYVTIEIEALTSTITNSLINAHADGYYVPGGMRE